MKRRLTVLFILIVLLPILSLGYLGIHAARSERLVLEQRFAEVALGRLHDVDERVAALVEQRERELLSLPPLSALGREELRSLVRESATVRQFFVMNDRDELRYPVSLELVREYITQRNDPQAPPLQPPVQSPTIPNPSPGFSETLSADEESFLERTHAIWTDKRIPAASSEGSVQTIYDKKGNPKHAPPPAPGRGWYAWHWDNGLNLIFWWRDETGIVVGAELLPVRFVADVIGLLPDTNPGGIGASERIALSGSKGETLYTWGNYEPPPGAKPLASLSLRAPLSSWRLEYRASDIRAAVPGNSVIINIASGIAVLVLSIVVLAFYYYRESSREIREATQRVNFVNQVSHELKTPLTSIRMYAEMLEGELDESDGKARSRLQVIVSESQRLSRLIGNVLTFGRNQRNALKIHPAPGNIDTVIRTVLRHFEPALASKGFDIDLDAGASQAVRFDQDALEQILGNLLSNIEKYAVNGTLVKVASRQEGDQTTILIADNGPGIPAKERRRIFEPFYRVSDKITDGVAGAGIGLAIARDLARLHGGDLTLETGDQGACFKLTIHAPQSEGQGDQA